MPDDLMSELAKLRKTPQKRCIDFSGDSDTIDGLPVMSEKGMKRYASKQLNISEQRIKSVRLIDARPDTYSDFPPKKRYELEVTWTLE